MTKILVLSGYVKDDFGCVFREIPRCNKFLITSSKNVAKDKLEKLHETFQEVIVVDDYYESGEVEVAAIRLHRRIQYDRVITPATGEFDLLRAAKLREYLGLSGQTYESALAFRDKHVMKTLITKAGINAPHFQKIDCAVDLLRFVDNYGYPIVIKPLRGVASLHTSILSTKDDVERFLYSSDCHFDKKPMMVETYVLGKMFHVDGLVVHGDVKAIWPSAYLGTAMDMIKGSYFANYLLPKEHSSHGPLVEFAKRVLRALPTPPTTAFHLEVFETEQGEIIFCEIASRAGGGYANSMWNEAFSIPLRDTFYRMQAGLDLGSFISPLSPKSIPSSIVMPKQTGTIEHIADSCPLSFVHRYVPFYKVGDVTEKSVDTMNPLLSAFIVGSSLDNTLAHIEEFLNWTQSTVRYAPENLTP